MEEKCKGCDEKQACISFFAHENAMMHKDADNDRLANIAEGQRKVNLIQSVIILLIVFCMAMFYTYRTRMWNETIAKQNETIIKLLNERSATEVADGVHKQPNP
jgi:hypothetical protein